MNTDRELLELAAKAAGIKFHSYVESEIFGSGINIGEVDIPLWNPLTDDGDRNRLARKLGISIDYEDCCAWTRKHGDLIQEFWGGDCPDEAHAIVGVAAEIGSRMGAGRPLAPKPQADIEHYAGATWDDDTLARLAVLMKSQAAVVLRFNTIGNLSGVQVTAPREATPAELTTAALTGMLPPGTYNPND